MKDLWPTLSCQPSFLSHVFILRKVLPLSSTKHSVIAVTWGVRGPKPLATCVLCHFHLSWLFQYLCDVCVCEQGSQPKTLGVLWWGREHTGRDPSTERETQAWAQSVASRRPHHPLAWFQSTHSDIGSLFTHVLDVKRGQLSLERGQIQQPVCKRYHLYLSHDRRNLTDCAPNSVWHTAFTSLIRNIMTPTPPLQCVSVCLIS